MEGKRTKVTPTATAVERGQTNAWPDSGELFICLPVLQPARCSSLPCSVETALPHEHHTPVWCPGSIPGPQPIAGAVCRSPSAWGINDASYERFRTREPRGLWGAVATAEASSALVGRNASSYKQSIIPLLQDLTRRPAPSVRPPSSSGERMDRAQHRCGGLHEIPSPLFDFGA